MPSSIMYCTKCGTRAGPEVQTCGKCGNNEFTNIPIKGKALPKPQGLLGAMGEWETTGKPPKIW